MCVSAHKVKGQQEGATGGEKAQTRKGKGKNRK